MVSVSPASRHPTLECRLKRNFSSALSDDEKRSGLKPVDGRPEVPSSRRALTGSFPSPPVLAPLPATPKRPLSAISLQEIAFLPGFNASPEQDSVETLGEQRSVTSTSGSSSTLSIATPTPGTAEPLATHALRNSKYEPIQRYSSPQERPQTGPVRLPSSRASSPEVSCRTSSSTAHTPLTPQFSPFEKQPRGAPLPSAKSFTSLSSQSTGRLPPDVRARDDSERKLD